MVELAISRSVETFGIVDDQTALGKRLSWMGTARGGARLRSSGYGRDMTARRLSLKEIPH
ncbi:MULTISPECIES: hypothetical protein [unclassified Bradyrhizobium]|uniref:hypothetical protein n=1 Tax=unclassified Bradyrhizobium TaxID=2631580 RepID=UPI0028F032AF|nr:MULTISPECIES: hypothetical protein [unclassified Bradyrhizobium]